MLAWLCNGRVRLTAGILGGLILLVLGSFRLFERFYPPILSAFLRHKVLFFTLPAFMLLFGAMTLLGFETIFAKDGNGSVPSGLAWSADGRQLAYFWGDGNIKALWVTNTEDKSTRIVAWERGDDSLDVAREDLLCGALVDGGVEAYDTPKSRKAVAVPGPGVDLPEAVPGSSGGGDAGGVQVLHHGAGGLLEVTNDVHAVIDVLEVCLAEPPLPCLQYLHGPRG